VVSSLPSSGQETEADNQEIKAKGLMSLRLCMWPIKQEGKNNLNTTTSFPAQF
jgi:hypothetical protein